VNERKVNSWTKTIPLKALKDCVAILCENGMMPQPAVDYTIKIIKPLTKSVFGRSFTELEAMSAYFKNERDISVRYFRDQLAKRGPVSIYKRHQGKPHRYTDVFDDVFSFLQTYLKNHPVMVEGKLIQLNPKIKILTKRSFQSLSSWDPLIADCKAAVAAFNRIINLFEDLKAAVAVFNRIINVFEDLKKRKA
jgi:hypothetical protein